MPRYSTEPIDGAAYKRRNDRYYSRFARLYDRLVTVLPFWGRLLSRALPFIEGPRVLEVSFGTGYLLTQYAGRVEAHGIDLNAQIVAVARRNLRRVGLSADLSQGDVEALPYPDASFDTVVCTAAFSGYPDAHQALSEMLRVLRPDGRLVLIDVGYPTDGNRLGTWLTRFWKLTDLIRDMDALFESFDLRVTHESVGGWGSIHLWVATRATAGHA